MIGESLGDSPEPGASRSMWATGLNDSVRVVVALGVWWVGMSPADRGSDWECKLVWTCPGMDVSCMGVWAWCNNGVCGSHRLGCDRGVTYGSG